MFGVSYLYDSLNRLTNVDYGNGSVISYTYDDAGNRLTYTGVVANDTIAPSISISNPTSAWSFTNTSATINLSGTASDNTGVTLVTWENDSGGLGVARGTTSWSINGIPLKAGVNYIFVTAYDAAGNSTDAMLAVTYVAPPVIRVTGFTIASDVAAQMTVVGPAGGVLAVQTSTDLVQWYTIGIVTNATGSFQFPLPFSSTESKRFFRAGTVQVPTNMVWIAPGTFTMGSPDTEQDRFSNEGPQTVVTLTKGFFMGKYLVTQTDYLAVVGTNPSYFTGDANRPVEQVAWNDATNYCAQLTQHEQQADRLPVGWVYRLPTEAEWEYACRAGTTTRFSFGDDPDYTMLAAYEWCAGSGGSYSTQPVGTRVPNPWGLYDMHGNVWEWCSDWIDWLPGGNSIDPTGPSAGSYRVIKGGCFYNGGRACRSAFRSGLDPAYLYFSYGFRVVLAPSQP